MVCVCMFYYHQKDGKISRIASQHQSTAHSPRLLLIGSRRRLRLLPPLFVGWGVQANKQTRSLVIASPLQFNYVFPHFSPRAHPPTLFPCTAASAPALAAWASASTLCVCVFVFWGAVVNVDVVVVVNAMVVIVAVVVVCHQGISTTQTKPIPPSPPPPKSIPSHPTHAPPRLLLRIGPLELPTLLSPRHQLGRGRRRRPRPRRLQLPLLLMPRRLRLLVQPLPAVPSFGVASVREQG